MYDDLRIPYQAGSLPSLQIGAVMVKGALITDAPIHLVLKSLNRHGLIAGATGSGKTKTIQVLCEQLSLSGVPSLVMDIKGDLSGLAMPGEATEVIQERSHSLNLAYHPQGFPVEFLTLNALSEGVPLRSTVSDFGPVLLSRMFDVNETQEGVITILFAYAKQENVPLIDLADLKSLLHFMQTAEGNKKIGVQFGAVASASVSTILRKIIELESQGGADFFGEPAFDVMNLLQVNKSGFGIISILRLLDMQDKPKLFSTFMLKLLTDIYRKMPEIGDPDSPKLVLFIDEAHLIFANASKALLSLLDTIVKLIRSKGVGLIFCTQTPNDLPESVLSQLGLKIQHTLRAFTAKDRKAMKLVAQNFPPSQHYNTEQLLTDLGIGQCLLSSLDAKGQPTPLVQCLNRAPESRMGIVTHQELDQLIASSTLYSHYVQRQESRSAHEIITEQRTLREQPTPSVKKANKKEASVIEAITKNTLFRQVARQLIRDMTRAILIALGIRKR
jgi:uncharacterized protein